MEKFLRVDNHLLSEEEKRLTPYDQARLFWERDWGKVEFDKAVANYCSNGAYLNTSPNSFLLMKLVRLDADLEKICNPFFLFDKSEVNCVFIVQMAGDLSHGFRNVPKELQFGYPYVSALRGGKYVYWKYSNLDRLIKGSFDKI